MCGLEFATDMLSADTKRILKALNGMILSSILYDITSREDVEGLVSRLRSNRDNLKLRSDP